MYLWIGTILYYFSSERSFRTPSCYVYRAAYFLFLYIQPDVIIPYPGFQSLNEGVGRCSTISFTEALCLGLQRAGDHPDSKWKFGYDSDSRHKAQTLGSEPSSQQCAGRSSKLGLGLSISNVECLCCIVCRVQNIDIIRRKQTSSGLSHFRRSKTYGFKFSLITPWYSSFV